jgi:hypothetical protein
MNKGRHEGSLHNFYTGAVSGWHLLDRQPSQLLHGCYFWMAFAGQKQYTPDAHTGMVHELKRPSLLVEKTRNLVILKFESFDR